MIAGQNRRTGMVVDYMDVMRQAVENERWKVLREVEDILRRKQVTFYKEYTKHDASFFRDGVLSDLKGLYPNE